MIEIHYGENNRIVPEEWDGAQPTSFKKGTVSNAFYLDLPGLECESAWRLGYETAVLSGDLARCKGGSDLCIRKDLSTQKIQIEKGEFEKYVRSRLTAAPMRRDGQNQKALSALSQAVAATRIYARRLPDRVVICTEEASCRTKRLSGLKQKIIQAVLKQYRTGAGLIGEDSMLEMILKRKQASLDEIPDYYSRCLATAIH